MGKELVHFDLRLPSRLEPLFKANGKEYSSALALTLGKLFDIGGDPKSLQKIEISFQSDKKLSLKIYTDRQLPEISHYVITEVVMATMVTARFFVEGKKLNVVDYIVNNKKQ